MTLVVETGEGVAGANTLVDLQTYTGWLVSRGIAAPADDATGVIELVKAMDYP